MRENRRGSIYDPVIFLEKVQQVQTDRLYPQFCCMEPSPVVVLPHTRPPDKG